MISPFFFILVSAGDCRFIRPPGGRSSADGARGTSPSGLPSIACGRDEGRICPFICAASARQKDSGPNGYTDLSKKLAGKI